MNNNKVYFFTDFKLINIRTLESFLKFLPSYRLFKYNKLIDEQKKMQSLLVYLILWFALKIDYGLCNPPEFWFKSNSKPLLKNHNIFFSLSHTLNAAACAIFENDVGLDIEHIRNIEQTSIKKICTDDEYLIYCKAKNKSEAFLKIWTKKESYVKLNHGNVFLNFKTLNSEDLHNVTTFKFENLIASVCSNDYEQFDVVKLSADFFKYLD